ncbi:MAG TPA: hypothetical protein VEG25_07820 [Burkholderiales bacterium]|nr:hypothetical protein [Burkholderiales bacterium]
MTKHKKLALVVTGAFALCGASAAHAFNVKAGDWDLSMSGEVNAFYSYTQCQNNARAIIGGTTCGTTFTNGASSVESGLLPSALVFSAKTTQEGFDIGVTFGFYPGINNGGQVSGANTSAAALPQPSALGSTGIDMRQNFFTFGDKDMGTIKMGRDLGFFGSDAILSDMTLLGVGTPQSPQNPGNTTLGRIGIGYAYADWIPQISYISPSFGGGFQVSAGIFQPFNMIGGEVLTNHSMPMIQAKGTWDFNSDSVKGRVWVGGLEQRATNAADNNDGATGLGGELGAKASMAGFDGLIYAYTGYGLGTTGIFLNGISATGSRRHSDGGYAQLQYTIGKWKPGFSYGFSQLKAAGGEQAANPNLVAFNRSAVGQLQYSLTKSLTLLGEYAHSWTTAQGANPTPALNSSKNIENSFSVGGILFF